MDAKGRERGILKLEPRPRIQCDARAELTPQGSWERAPAPAPSSPQPSVDRLSVTWADPGTGSMASTANLFHLPQDAPPNNEVKFSPGAGDGSDDEDYSASLSAVLRQRRASVRRSRKGRARRPSSPIPDENRARRRSSVFTTSSGDTAISMEECQPGAAVTQEQIFENIHLHKEVLGSVKQQPLGMRRKLKIVHQAKAYIKRHEGQLQERLAQSKSTRDIYARFNILLATKWQQLKREAANTSNLLIPWELRIKEIESHFGSVVASYFTFLRWLFWVNLVIAFILLIFVIVPEYLTTNPQQDGERKTIMEEEVRNATNLLTLWEFEGVLKYSPIFYGYYSNVERPQYRMPLAYFLTGIVVYIYSFVAILRKMAENSRMSKLSEKEDECIFSWKLFTGWDFMIGNTETAQNRIASIILGFKEALLEEAEKKKDLRNWRIISLRALVNIGVVFLLAVSAYAVVTVVSRSDDNNKERSWWRENETTVVVTVISITFPVFFEVLGYLEHYHPRKQLRLQLARIMLLNLLNLYSLIFALISKIDGMSRDLDMLKPTLSMNATTIPDSILSMSESIAQTLPVSCFEEAISCAPCTIPLSIIPFDVDGKDMDTLSITKMTALMPAAKPSSVKPMIYTIKPLTKVDNKNGSAHSKKLLPQYLIDKEWDPDNDTSTTTDDIIALNKKELDKLRNQFTYTFSEEEPSSEVDDNEYSFDYFSTESRNNRMETETTQSTYTTENVSNTSSTTELDFQSSSSATELDFQSSSISSNKIYETSVGETSQNTRNAATDTTFDKNHDSNSISSTEIYETLVEETSQSTNNAATDTILDKNSDSIPTDSISSTVNYISHAINTMFNKDDNKSLLDTSTRTYESSTESDSNNYSYMTSDTTGLDYLNAVSFCPNITFNCTGLCGNKNVTQVFYISNCTRVEKSCYRIQCHYIKQRTNVTTIDIVYEDENKRRMYNLTKETRKKLLKLCWETMFGQELVKLTMMDLVFVLLGTLFMDFFRALFVRYMNRCWCWDLEKKFPEYGDFKIAENILHLINNQGMVWMGMFFSPGLVVLNVSKLMIMMYLRSWAVMTCNVPHEVVFRVSKSNNFYLALLLTMLFLCVLPVGYTIVRVKPSWHCGPFSEYDKIYSILTTNIYKILPNSLGFILDIIASPAIVIPLLVLLILIIYYLTSLTNSLREANNDLKIQLRRERTEERRKMFQLADTRRRAGSTALDNTPFARWKRALPSLPLSKSIDSDDRRTLTGEETEPSKVMKKRGGIFAKIVSMALDRKSDVAAVSEVHISPSSNNDDETDTDFHETLPKDVLKIKHITIGKQDHHKKNTVEFKSDLSEENKFKIDDSNLSVTQGTLEDRTEKKAVILKREHEKIKECDSSYKSESSTSCVNVLCKEKENKDDHTNTAVESNSQSKQLDSTSSIIPVITISTTESDDEILSKGKEKADSDKKEESSKRGKNGSDSKSLRRQSSVDSVKESKIATKEKTREEGHKYQYSL